MIALPSTTSDKPLAYACVQKLYKDTATMRLIGSTDIGSVEGVNACIVCSLDMLDAFLFSQHPSLPFRRACDHLVMATLIHDATDAYRSSCIQV